jgi:hypothetical protein
MIKIKATLSNVLMLTMSVVTLALASAHAGDSSARDAASLAVPPVDNPCPRLAAGSALHNPPALVSRHGVLMARFSYQTTTDEDGRTLFCFMTPDGAENPTLDDRVVSQSPLSRHQYFAELSSGRCPPHRH